MDFPIATSLAANFFLDPIRDQLLLPVIGAIDGVVHNYGVTMIVLAALVRLVFWPLSTFQFKSMLKMQSIAPKAKAIAAKYKNDPERRNAETMALYKESGANPLAGCVPLLLQYPIIISVFYAVLKDKDVLAKSTFLWIGSPLSQVVPYHLLATNLAQLDYLLLGLYAISMYISVRFTTPAADEQAAQQQKIMAFVSPAMIVFFAIKGVGSQYQWPSALLVYWLFLNAFAIAQQLYLINKYHRNPAPIGPHPEGEPPAIPEKKPPGGANGPTTLVKATPVGQNGGAARPNGAKRRRARR